VLILLNVIAMMQCFDEFLGEAQMKFNHALNQTRQHWGICRCSTGSVSDLSLAEWSIPDCTGRLRSPYCTNVRCFIILHDCGHGSFFKSAIANHIVGTFCGILTQTPYFQWMREHAIHYASSGDLGRRGVGDVTTLTVKEYLALSLWGRVQYRLYRNPIVMLLIGP